MGESMDSKGNIYEVEEKGEAVVATNVETKEVRTFANTIMAKLAEVPAEDLESVKAMSRNDRRLYFKELKKMKRKGLV